MGRLAGFSYREVTKKLGKLGFEFYRAAKGDHEIWFNAATNQKTTIPHHREIKEGTLRSILKQAQIDVDIFLDV
ncbi:MAG: type II toxin-antitoxin system HicA family toxin [Dolichospermum sp.]|jgi:predicted RNA binding protein YcfA (HicA-like mRNA interferase family)|uniref:type II toxin-antitoxin system HicA family toxin n=1 Tax=Dolichospermum circinale TaxID=109265 RepID=UPI00232B8D7B|nr:type II toxin-antitoxin system HicA family toxin [Dolichospermum circinale]MCE2717511.1 type II toxin-antitoxin system HicA family toxin [Anabaena sp. 49628_E55]MDB9452956.1 type II toxin-antitoxin system HicA family toxin [Dolichospermum circinale CS-541/06]MDB9461927.1 type II toxin-antitoxin system HicA family toxin [Dolichospermum circinale CS-541/04]MDB9490454.1 type II toxin-antitoxin system HicA family toxin [Dolichospermum circinale CS-534/05]MDB9546845.1 type II toxin-antitoxin sys